MLSESPSEGHLCNAVKSILPLWQQGISMGKLSPIHCAPPQGVFSSLGDFGDWGSACIPQYFPYVYTGW